MKIAIIMAVIFLTAFGAMLLSAGDISPILQDKVTSLGSDDFVRVLIKPVAVQNAATFKADVNRHKTRMARHRTAMVQLRQEADASQNRLRSLLQSQKRISQARNLKFFWISSLIEAEITTTLLEDLTNHPDVELIELYPEIVLLEKTEIQSPSINLAGLEPNLTAVNAPAAWAAGYDGSGRLVCNFDTGVEGDHPALDDNYHGNKGFPPSQCWYSPTDSSTFPHSFAIPHYPSTESHGTHTMGIMVGHDDISGDTIGVAPGADWIAAVAFDVAGSSIIDAFQWAADPDGDPNTVSDVPDVINHSWGLTWIGCDNIFWDLIDNTEALGIVNIFSAGNQGPAASSISNPANRATDSITNFGVGAINYSDSSIYSFSSRGPSDCDDESIKPNLVAPGSGINSSIPGSTYGSRSGTSMAAPHVAGAVAILRQKNPDATVSEIKTALLTSGYDLGDVGPDNSFGWGLLDISAALDKISAISEPSLELSQTSYSTITPGDSLGVSIQLKNVGVEAVNVTAQFSNPDAGLSLYTTDLTFGDITGNAAALGDTTLDIKLDISVTEGDYLGLDIDIYIDGVFHRQQRLSFLVGERSQRSYYNHDTGRLRFTISNFGTYGFGGESYSYYSFGSYLPFGFSGFQLDRDTNDLYEASFMIGYDSAHVSDNAQNYLAEADNDFSPATGGAIAISQPGEFADVETSSKFNDSRAENPLGVEIKQNSYAWNSAPDDNFIILEYIITNNSGGALSNLFAGLYINWNINDYLENRSDFLSGSEIGFIYWTDEVDSSDFRGVKILEPTGSANHFALSVGSEVQNGAFDEGTKFKSLSDPTRPSYIYSSNIAHVTSVGPIDLAYAESTKIAFAVAGGETLTLFETAALQAELRYSEILTDTDDPNDLAIPDRLTLRQNYPNPFNPTTTIAFALPQSGQVEIDIYNILGEGVKTLVDEKLPAGNHKVAWDGTDNSSESVASGIYFYKISYGKTSQTKKMILLK